MGSRHKNFYYYDMGSGKIITVVPPVKALDEYQRPSMSANFEISPDNRLIAFVGSQGQIHLFSVKVNYCLFYIYFIFIIYFSELIVKRMD
jgi:hypothetical protein